MPEEPVAEATSPAPPAAAESAMVSDNAAPVAATTSAADAGAEAPSAATALTSVPSSEAAATVQASAEDASAGAAAGSQDPTDLHPDTGRVQEDGTAQHAAGGAAASAETEDSPATDTAATNDADGDGASGAGSGGAREDEDTRRTKVFVGGLAWGTKSEALAAHFERFGPIKEAIVITDKQTMRSKGYGFVTFTTPEAAAAATVDGNPTIDGRRANCNLAALGARRTSRPRSYQSQGSYSGSGSGSGGQSGGNRRGSYPSSPLAQMYHPGRAPTSPMYGPASAQVTNPYAGAYPYPGASAMHYGYVYPQYYMQYANAMNAVAAAAAAGSDPASAAGDAANAADGAAVDSSAALAAQMMNPYFLMSTMGQDPSMMHGFAQQQPGQAQGHPQQQQQTHAQAQQQQQAAAAAAAAAAAHQLPQHQMMHHPAGGIPQQQQQQLGMPGAMPPPGYAFMPHTMQMQGMTEQQQQQIQQQMQQQAFAAGRPAPDLPPSHADPSAMSR